MALLCVPATANSIRFEVDSEVSGFAKLPMEDSLPTGKIVGGRVDLVMDEASGRIEFGNVDLRQVDAPPELLFLTGTPIELPIVDTCSGESSLYNQILSIIEGSLISDNLIRFGEPPPGWHYSFLSGPPSQSSIWIALRHNRIGADGEIWGPYYEAYVSDDRTTLQFVGRAEYRGGDGSAMSVRLTFMAVPEGASSTILFFGLSSLRAWWQRK